MFLDVEKAYGMVPRELVCYSLRRNGVPDAYVNITRVVYAGCKTSVMTSAGNTPEIYMDV